MDKISKHDTRQKCKLQVGLDGFLDLAFANKSVDAKIICPCKNCGNETSGTVKVAKDHLNSVGFTEGYAKNFGHRKVTSSILSHSPTSGENKMNFMEEANGIKLLNDFEEGLLPRGNKGRKLHDFLSKLLHHKHSAKVPDKSISMLLECTKELFSVRDGADPPKSFSEMLPFSGEEEDKKTPREKQNQPNASTSGCEEEDNTTPDEKRNQPSASTSSGLVGISTKEENRRKLREKINQRKESRSSRIR